MTPKVSKPVTVVIDRSKWLTGDVRDAIDLAASSLRDGFCGLQCCLGFMARQAGLRVADITDSSTVSSLVRTRIATNREVTLRGPLAEVLISDGFNDTLATINDDEHLMPKAREKKLRAEAARYGITLTFTGRRPSKATLKKLRADYRAHRRLD